MKLTSDSLLPTAVSRPAARHAAAARTHQGIPGIEKLPSGRLFATWYTGGTCECKENYAVLAISDDDGASWREVPAVIDPVNPEVRAFDAALWRATDGRLYWFWAQGCGGEDGITGEVDEVFDGLVGVWFSVIENPDAAPEAIRFTAPRRIENGIMLNKPTVLRDGCWLLPCSLWSVKSIHRDFHRERHPVYGAMTVVSTDNGGTFRRRGTIDVCRRDVEPSFDEHQFLELADGSIACYVRCLDGVGRAVSRDGGESWSQLAMTALPGIDCRFHIRRLASGRVLLVANNSGTVREKITAFLSEDDGASWPYQLLIDPREGASYPDAVEDAGHCIYISHDYNRTKGGFLYLSKITEADIIRGKIGQDSFLCREISHSRPVPEKPADNGSGPVKTASKP